MVTRPQTPPSSASSAQRGGHESGLIPQPERPTQFPIRVPVAVECGGTAMEAEVIGSTENVLLLQATHSKAANLPALGTPTRLRVEWDRQVLNGRIAAHGVANRFLVSLGERAIRRSRRFPVDLPATARSGHVYGPREVRVTDLSTGGARVEGIDLPAGTELELRFAPPGQPEPLTVLGFVVRAIEGAQTPTAGVAFRLAQPSIEALGRAARA